MRIDYKKIKKKYKKYKRQSERKISEYYEEALEKAKQLYIKMSYINDIGKQVILKPIGFAKTLVIQYKETIEDTARYYFNLVLYILMYGLPFNLALHLATKHFFANPIPFGIGWIYVIGITCYALKEEVPRILRNCFPQKTGGVIHHE